MDIAGTNQNQAYYKGGMGGSAYHTKLGEPDIWGTIGDGTMNLICKILHFSC